MTIVHESQINGSPLLGRRVGILGYGSQGRAHAQILRDRGIDVRVGTRPDGQGRRRAEADGFPAYDIAAVTAWADVISVLLPDQVHAVVYRGEIAPYLEPGKTLVFAHGFSITYGEVVPRHDVDVVLVAPVGPGRMIRDLFVQGSGVPAVVAVHQDASGGAESVALALASALGLARVGVIRTTFREETETDLFGEQAILCGGIPYLIRDGFDTLVRAGYQPEIAFFECVHQVKLIVDLIHDAGFEYLFSHISDTARFGAMRAGPEIAGPPVRAAMERVLADVRSGAFARAWINQYRSGMPDLQDGAPSRDFESIEDVRRTVFRATDEPKPDAP